MASTSRRKLKVSSDDLDYASTLGFDPPEGRSRRKTKKAAKPTSPSGATVAETAIAILEQRNQLVLQIDGIGRDLKEALRLFEDGVTLGYPDRCQRFAAKVKTIAEACLAGGPPPSG